MSDMSQITDHTLPPAGIWVSGFDPLLGMEGIEAFGIDAREDGILLQGTVNWWGGRNGV